MNSLDFLEMIKRDYADAEIGLIVNQKVEKIEQELKTLEHYRETILDKELKWRKQNKVLEIIKKSIVEMSDSKVLMGDYYQVVLALDQEEYDLLKEILV